VQDVVLLENASAAINGILRSLPLRRGDKVLRLSTAYGMCIYVLDWLESFIGIEQVVVRVRFPYGEDGDAGLLADVAEALAAQPAGSVKVALFSHISSMPTLIEPVAALTRLCKSHVGAGEGCVVIVDGAHAPGVILPLDVEAIGADFYTGNLHKWCFTPKGCAFLHTAAAPAGAARDLQQEVHGVQPLVISSSGKPGYVDRFAYTGTRDYTALAAIPDSFAFVDKHLGGFACMTERNHALLLRGCQVVSDRWGGTGTLVTAPRCVGVMMDVIAPPAAQSEAALLRIQAALEERHDLFFVYGKTLLDADAEAEAEQAAFTWFVRLSAQVYLDLSQFELFADRFLAEL